jgi:site-specific DNA recombinase
MSRKLSDVPTVRCAIYTRESTKEGLEREPNSLDTQRESAEVYIKSQRHKGWICIPDHYDDVGFNGGTMERPALKRLMADIEAGSVDCVVVDKVDRLSRSLSDLAQLKGKFEEHQIAFVSLDAR